MSASTQPPSAEELRRRFHPIYTGALTDVLFELGYGAQALPAGIQGLKQGARLAGPAYTYERRPFVSPIPVDEAGAWDVFRACPPDHVAVYVTHSADRAIIGDLAIAFLKVLGCSGLVVDGGVRDVDALDEIGLPVFCHHTTPQDVSHGNGGEFAHGHQVSIGEVRVAVRDYIVGDGDGVVVIPSALVGEVLERAEHVVEVETGIRAAILRGESPEEAFRRLAGSG
jgi:4-hydroxy-4-methyl-2-oxoglutarate aldolase